MLTLGIDEVGRGAWAGPLAVGAVVLDSARVPDGLADSKKLTKKQREKLTIEIKKSAVAIGVGWVSATDIDKIGLGPALKLAAQRTVAQIPPEIRAKLDQIIIDGTVDLLAGSVLAGSDPAIASKVTILPKADAKIAAVSAAAIVAKVFRDHYMAQLEKVFPDYNFANHVGYGTALHQQKLTKFGIITGVHRQSFAPIAKISSVPFAGSDPANINFAVGFNPTAKGGRRVEQTTGRIAENAAAEYLEKLGHQIIAQNWKTKFCEIDIISEHKNILYFTEVKYRANARHGDGLAAITPRKLKQMKFAAELYLNKNALALAGKYDVHLSAISLSQTPPQVDEFIENVF
jgi:ribonuclease HII